MGNDARVHREWIAETHQYLAIIINTATNICNLADLARSTTCKYLDLHARTVSHFHADYLEFHLTHATDRNTVTTRRKQKQLFLQFQRKRQNHIPKVPGRESLWDIQDKTPNFLILRLLFIHEVEWNLIN